MGIISMAAEITISELSIRKPITPHKHQLSRPITHKSMTPDDPQTRVVTVMFSLALYIIFTERERERMEFRADFRYEKDIDLLFSESFQFNWIGVQYSIVTNCWGVVRNACKRSPMDSGGGTWDYHRWGAGCKLLAGEWKWRETLALPRNLPCWFSFSFPISFPFLFPISFPISFSIVHLKCETHEVFRHKERACSQSSQMYIISTNLPHDVWRLDGIWNHDDDYDHCGEATMIYVLYSTYTGMYSTSRSEWRIASFDPAFHNTLICISVSHTLTYKSMK